MTRKPGLEIPSRAFAVEGEKSHKNQRRSTLHSPNRKMKRTCHRVTGATPDTSGLRPLSRPVRRAKERGQNSVRGMCYALLKFGKKTTGQRADFCSELRPARGRFQNNNTTINHKNISIGTLGEHCIDSGGIYLLWLSQHHFLSAVVF